MSTINVAKLVIETLSPMAIATGSRETNFDTALVRDINGLPMIPASAVAGVWSHLTQRHLGGEVCRDWFGADKSAKQGDFIPSKLTITDARLHDSNNQPVVNYMTPELIAADLMLKTCVLDRPHHRDRVAINDRSVAKENAKFDQIVLPKGLRFSVIVRWQGELDSANAILRLWSLRQMAFGASTRNGLGQVALVASEIKSFDLKQGESKGKALQAYVFDRRVPTEQAEFMTTNNTSLLLAQLPLKALDNWRSGSGSEVLNLENKDKNVGIITYSEPSWHWEHHRASNDNGTMTPVFCGSSIKGILAHRMAYHYRKHCKMWAENIDKDFQKNLKDGLNPEEIGKELHKKWQTRPEELKYLLGHADDTDHAKSIAGLLMVDDCPLRDYQTTLRYHNAIDRFTGGVRKGALYSEELLYQPKFTVKIWLTSLPTAPSTDEEKTAWQYVIQAFKDTVRDIELGLLPMGAGSGRGSSLVEKSTHDEWICNDALLLEIQGDNA
ncbi:RAMP superfamily CRISPR-associated protein [Photobacterium toruni]|uniref:RAMP superfamily protein n=1 Tax=Photobacterium toruni TaxID=1935446 RepID=A0A1T4UGZ8_9GAMM|nr:RAMP superfamily CRISPR-associated protein [Photobacterium toruni]SKA51876.1 RAMP superfamily protein [Photobacterium toruni]